MKNTNYIAGNKLIATFMNHGGGDNDEYNNKPLDYHLHWNFLMSVVEKINKWHSDTMCNKMDFYLLNQSICSSKEMVWQGCLEFINWYNESLKTVK